MEDHSHKDEDGLSPRSRSRIEAGRHQNSLVLLLVLAGAASILALLFVEGFGLSSLRDGAAAILFVMLAPWVAVILGYDLIVRNCGTRGRRRLQESNEGQGPPTSKALRRVSRARRLRTWLDPAVFLGLITCGVGLGVGIRSLLSSTDEPWVADPNLMTELLLLGALSFAFALALFAPVSSRIERRWRP